MSFKVKGHDILNPLFIPAMKSLSDMKLEFRIAWNVRRMLKQFDAIVKEVQQGQADLIMKFAEKDEKGNLLPQKDDDGKFIPNSYTIPDNKVAELNVEGMKLMSKEYIVNSGKLTIDDLKDTKLSATDLEIIDLVLDAEKE